MVASQFLIETTTISQILKKNSNNKIDKFGIGRNDIKHTKKLGKLSKSRKKLSKSGNLTNFKVIKARSKFLTPNIKTIFNYL